MEVSSELDIFPEISEPKKKAFLYAYCEVMNITRAAKAADHTPRNHYHWMANDPVYASAFHRAKAVGADMLECEAVRRAQEGVRRLKFYQGQPITDPETGKPYFEHEYSDTLLIFLLNGAKPEKYKHRVESSGDMNLNHSGGVHVYLPQNNRNRLIEASANGNGHNGHNGNGYNGNGHH